MARPATQPAVVVTSVILTQSDSIRADEPAVRAPSRVHRWWSVPLAVAGVLAAVAPMVAIAAPARWFVEKFRCTERDETGECVDGVSEEASYALVPADAEPVGPRVTLTGVPTYSSAGGIYFVTIREPAIQLLDWMGMGDDPAARLRSDVDKFGDRTPDERLRDGQRQMSGAKEFAIYLALTRAGLEPEFVPGSAMVDYVICLEANEAQTECLEYTPAGDFLEELDVIIELDGDEVTVIDDVGVALSDREPGDVVSITVERLVDGRVVEVEGEVEVIAAPGEPERTIVGFMAVDTRTLELPPGVEVVIETDNIGGPSAGLAFTLTLIDELTEGDLTGGVRVAVTGAINSDGTVGAIGGLNSKASAVQQMGVDYLLVPASQPDDPRSPDSIAAARAVVGDDVEIIPVATLEEALEVLARLGGDPIPPAPEPATTG